MLPPAKMETSSQVSVGDRVWVKPPGGSCTTRWSEGRVTGVTSENNVSVNGVPRHILDVRRMVENENGQDSVIVDAEIGESSDVRGLHALFEGIGEVEQVPAGGVGAESAAVVESRPTRNTRAPAYLRDYVM